MTAIEAVVAANNVTDILLLEFAEEARSSFAAIGALVAASNVTDVPLLGVPSSSLTGVAMYGNPDQHPGMSQVPATVSSYVLNLVSIVCCSYRGKI